MIKLIVFSLLLSSAYAGVASTTTTGGVASSTTTGASSTTTGVVATQSTVKQPVASFWQRSLAAIDQIITFGCKIFSLWNLFEVGKV
uniref:Uncharacterized protein n=1 Tax=Trichobilharzia regenti TaxID=157069 RepID=A0AA85IUC0_TRIRE|nr:unnamed protein product [Trichobilharzia regenti]